MLRRVIAGVSPALIFEDPVAVWAPRTFSGALEALAGADEALNAGYYVAGALSYEFGAMLQAVPAHDSAFPLLLLGAFRKPRSAGLPDRGGFSMSAPLCRVGAAEYAANIERIRERIRDGEVYQVNYTVPFDAALEGDRSALYAFLARRSGARYSAYLESDDVTLVSISPELFLRFDGGEISTKPMKGTAPLDDIAQLGNEKNRAEHVMIVDLLRNDLHRVCERVRVERLFDVERYPTFATMTSTIAGTLRGARFADVIRATFPCGSVTGAPKRAAMEHIANLESQARGFYTGSIGFLSPERRGWWNVAIRTLQFERDAPAVRFDAGGGIVVDSRADDEWAEVFVKARFLQPAHAPFRLLETLRCGADAPDPLPHVQRLAASAAAFNVAVDIDTLRARLTAWCEELQPHLVRVRAGDGAFEIEASALDDTPQPVALCMSSVRVRSGDPLLAHKTSWRPLHEAAALEARARGCFDALICNERGELTEGSRTTLFVQIDGVLYTPPLSSGVLPGVLRAQMLAQGTAFERVLFPADLSAAQSVYVGNSARGLLRAEV